VDTVTPPTDPDLSPALELVVRRFGQLMRSAARKHGLSEPEIDDALQDVRIRLWRSLRTGENIRRAPASYVYRTVVSAALDFLRRRRTRREEVTATGEESAFERDDALAPADAAVNEADVAQAVARAIGQLVESRRGVVRMYLAGYDREEIAEVLGWSEAKTRNLLYRGLADLRATLTAWGYAPKGGDRT
jgi:RNA polymerase sigma factor (sigma-70 family)